MKHDEHEQSDDGYSKVRYRFGVNQGAAIMKYYHGKRELVVVSTWISSTSDFFVYISCIHGDTQDFIYNPRC